MQFVLSALLAVGVGAISYWLVMHFEMIPLIFKIAIDIV